MGKGQAAVEKHVHAAVEQLFSRASIKSQVGEMKLRAGEWVFVNNSFLFREGRKKPKSKKYLALKANSEKELDLGTLAVDSPPSFNVDLKQFSGAKKQSFSPEAIGSAIKQQLSSLGSMVFVLLGHVDDKTECEIPIDSSAMMKSLKFSPRVKGMHFDAATGVVTTNDLSDADALWNTVELAYKNAGNPDGIPVSSRTSLEQAFEKLQKTAYCEVTMPEDGSKASKESMLARMLEALNEQCHEYEASFKLCKGVQDKDPDAFNNSLRIAYNFSSDATKLIKLLGDLCDAKPLLWWCTIAEQYDLAEAFHNLPWANRDSKGSLPRYQSMIAAARNHAFHNLFSFTRALEVDLSGVTLAAKTLRLFSPYSRTNDSNLLDYDDREIVELLTTFTCAPEIPMSASFWEKNMAILNSTCKLVDAMLTGLGLLWEARP
jgi:hypothetical protein